MLKLITAFVLLTVSCLALAHPGHINQLNFYQGLLYPLANAEHLFSLLAIGLLAGQASYAMGKLIYPSLFMLALMIGLTFSLLGLSVGSVEAATAYSVLVFGILLLFHKRLHWLANFSLVAGFAFCHGIAYADIASQAHGAGFLFGALLSSAMALVASLLMQTHVIKNWQPAMQLSPLFLASSSGLLLMSIHFPI